MNPPLPPPNSDPVLVTRALAKTFRDFWRRPKVRALRPLDLQLSRGEVFGLLGPNGSGKSTTIKLLLGLLRPSAGEIEIFGADRHDPRVRERIGYLPELTCLHRALTPDELLDYYGALSNLPRRERRRRADQLLALLDLEGRRSSPIGEFSKGMARRVGLAQALIHNPDLVILDEPTSGLDPIACRGIKDLIRTLADQGRTVLMSSHLLADVEDICDRIAILFRGETLAIGAVKSLLSPPGAFRLAIDAVSEEDALEKRRRIVETLGIEADLERPSIGLEQYFLDVIRNREAKSSGATPEALSLRQAPFLQTPRTAPPSRTPPPPEAS